MIARTPGPWQTAPWQRQLAEAVSNPGELLEILELDPGLLGPTRAASEAFRLKVPHGFLRRIRRGDPDDPLLRQVLPLGAELKATPGFRRDPVGDLAACPTAGVLHKYQGRALLMVTGACAVHCRYCFRRHFPYGEASLPGRDPTAALDYLRANADIREVILSGGDPLALPDRRLSRLSEHLDDIPHLKRLRIHSRLPVMIPERVDECLLAWLGRSRLRIVMVVHINHPREIDGPVQAALQRLRTAGVELLNQSVLLAGVNDDARVLAELSDRLFENRVLPYYLHLLDRVQGAAHFEVEERRALELHGRLQSMVSGYLLPRLVREQPRAPAKLPLLPG